MTLSPIRALSAHACSWIAPAAAIVLMAGPVWASGGSPTVLEVARYGVVPESPDNQEAMRAAIEAARAQLGPVELRFQPGAAYRIGLPSRADQAQRNQYAIDIKGINELTLNGQGATLVVTNPEIGAIRTEDCNGVVIKNLNVDYNPLPFTQGKITVINLDERWFEVKLDEGYPTLNEEQFERCRTVKGNWGITVRDHADGGKVYGPVAVYYSKWEDRGNGVLRLYPKDPPTVQRDSIKQLNVGDAFVCMSRNWAQAVSARNCEDLTWEGITVFASPGISFFPLCSGHVTIRGCQIKPGVGRLLSSNGGGIIPRGSRGHLLIEDCSFEGMADDGINIHSSPLSIKSQPAPNQVSVRKHTFSVRVGDELVLVRSANAEVLSTAVVTQVKDEGGTWLLTLDRALPDLSSGRNFASSDNLYNLSESADPFIVRGCRFGNYRGRGVLLSAHGGLIEQNEFFVREGWAVQMHYESTRWGEGPISYAITVRDNTFHGQGGGTAAVSSSIHTREGAKVEGRPFHQLLIEGNDFIDYSSPIVSLADAEQAQVLDNTVIFSEKAPYRRKAQALVVLENCADIDVAGLEVQGSSSTLEAAVEIGADCQADSINVSGIRSDPPGLKPVVQR